MYSLLGDGGVLVSRNGLLWWWGGGGGGGTGGGGNGGGAGPAVAECAQFVSFYSWGSVRSADIKLGAETASNARIQVIADPAFPSVPHACSSTGAAGNSVQSLGANGLIGLGNFAQDCGQRCSVQASNGYYYSCTGGTCAPIAVSIAKQVWNPVAFIRWIRQQRHHHQPAGSAIVRRHPGERDTDLRYRHAGK